MPDRRPLLVGANPAVQLLDDTGACTAYASCWRVDWSVRGSGNALVLWRASEVVVHATDAALGQWLAEDFVQHFAELRGLPWTTPRCHTSPGALTVSLSSGVRARMGPVAVVASRVLSPRVVTRDDVVVGGRPASLSLVVAPCASGAIIVGSNRVPGRVRRNGTPERPTSSAFVAEAEVWYERPPVGRSGTRP